MNAQPDGDTAAAPEFATAQSGGGHLDPRSHGIQVFSAPSDAPRVRSRADLLSAAFNAALLTFLVIVAGEGSTIDRTTLEFVGELPGWLLWFGQAAYVLGVLYAFGLLLGVGLLARRRLEVLRDMLFAAGLAVVGVLLLTRFVDGRWPEFAFFDLDETAETFPAFFITTGAAIQAAAAPHLSAPMRKIGWTFVLGGSVASVIGGVVTVTDALGGVLAGLISAAFIRFAFGTTAGLPSTNRIRDGLADLGLLADDVRYADDQPVTAALLSGTSIDGVPLFIAVLGRDAWSTRRLSRLWRRAWYHDEGSQHGSDRRQEFEHEALVGFLASRAGVAVPELVTVGMSERDDAMLVTKLLDRTLGDVPADDVGDDLLAAIWAEVGRLHGAGLSHGALDSRHVWLDTDDAPALVGLADSVISATNAQQHEDVAVLLVTTTLIVGPDRAIAAARAARGDEDLAAMLPVLQTAALGGELRQQARHEKLKVSDLRKQTAAALGIEVPQVEQLTRVSWKSALMVVFVGFAAYTLIGGLAEVGFDTIIEVLSDARWGLVLIALVLAQSTNYTDAVAVSAVSPKPVPIGVTTVEQFAIGFVNIAVPSSAGRIATNARFFQKFGIGAVTSTATGAITGFVGFVAQTILIVLTIITGKGSIDFSELESDGGVIRLLVAAVVIFVVVTVVVSIVPSWRKWAWGKIEKPVSQIGDALKVVRDPKTAVLALSSSLGTEILYGSGLAMCVLAVGGSVSIGEAIFINVVVSLFAGLMPVPGGIGVSEAGLTAGLTAVGVPSEIAVSAVIVYRLISYYLPPIWGYLSLRWLVRHDYL